MLHQIIQTHLMLSNVPMRGSMSLEEILNSKTVSAQGIRSIIIESRSGFKDVKSLKELFTTNELQIKQFSFYENGASQAKKLQEENDELKRRLAALEAKLGLNQSTEEDDTPPF